MRAELRPWAIGLFAGSGAAALFGGTVHGFFGDATTLAAIRGVAVAPGLNRLFAVSAERQLQAWQLPPITSPPQG